MGRDGIISSRSGTATRYGMSLPAVPGMPSAPGAAVQVVDAAATATALLYDAADATVTAMTQDMTAYKKLVEADWPYKTGYSKKHFSILTEATGTIFTVTLHNSAPYSGMIKQLRGFAEPNPAIRIVFNHTDPLVDKMAQDVATYLAE